MSNVTSFAHAPTQPCLLVVLKYPENAKGQNKGESIDEVYENLIKRMKRNVGDTQYRTIGSLSDSTVVRTFCRALDVVGRQSAQLMFIR